MGSRNRISDRDLYFLEDNVALLQQIVKYLERATVARNLTEMGPHLLAISLIVQKLYEKHVERYPSTNSLPPLDPNIAPSVTRNLDNLQDLIDSAWHEVRALRQSLGDEPEQGESK